LFPYSPPSSLSPSSQYFPPTEDLFEVSARKKLAHNNDEELVLVPESLFGRDKFKKHVQVSKQITGEGEQGTK